MTSLQPHEQREILALSFEPNGDGFVYYHYGWSRGIPVTLEEREAYLAISVYGSRRDWRKALAGRETFPPRDYKLLQVKILEKMPHRVAMMTLASGVGILISAFIQESGVGEAVSLVIGCTMIIFAISVFAARRKTKFR
jgi:hypothetical protein